MSLKTFIIQAEDTAIAALKEVGTIVEGVVLTIGQQLVAKVKSTDVGTMAMNVISLLESHQTSGEAKMATLLGLVTPAIKKVDEAGGLKGLETSVEDFAKEFAQSAYNDFVAVAPKVEAVAESAATKIVEPAIQPIRSVA